MKRHKLKTGFHALTVNYRSQQNILNLANNLVEHLRWFYPDTFELLPPEASPKEGPLPVVIPLGQDDNHLMKFMKTHMGVTYRNEHLSFPSG